MERSDKIQLNKKIALDNEKNKFTTNRFYYHAKRYMDRIISDEEIMKFDMTDEFYLEIEQEVKNDELIIMNLNAKVRMGKSSLGIYLAMYIYYLLKKYKKEYVRGEFGINNIARDQQEYSKIMRNHNTRFTVIMTDEINKLEQTGVNSSTESAMNDDFSNVQAGRYVHRVSCSPKDSVDPNADIFLEVVSINRKTFTTHCHLYYKMFRGGNEVMQLIGHVNICIKDLIYRWEKEIKSIFFKEKRTKKENEILEKACKEDFYINYVVKKYEKMDLMTKEGVMRPRLLEYSNIIMEVEEKLRKLSKINLNRATIKNYIKMYCRKEKIPLSIAGEELMTQEVEGMLSLWKSYYKVNDKIIMVESKIEKYNNNEGFKKMLEDLKEMSIELSRSIGFQLEEYKRYKEIYEKYNSHILKNENK